jgi:hypothetical protein
MRKGASKLTSITISQQLTIFFSKNTSKKARKVQPISVHQLLIIRISNRLKGLITKRNMYFLGTVKIIHWSISIIPILSSQKSFIVVNICLINLFNRDKIQKLMSILIIAPIISFSERTEKKLIHFQQQIILESIMILECT